MSSEPVAAVGALAASGFMDCARVCRNCLSLATMSVAGVSAGAAAAGAVLGCSAANNLVKAASRRLLLTVGVAGGADATGVVVLVVAASVDVAVAVAAVAGTAAVLVATVVAAVDAVELPAGAPSVWASCPMRCARSP